MNTDFQFLICMLYKVVLKHL